MLPQRWGSPFKTYIYFETNNTIFEMWVLAVIIGKNDEHSTYGSCPHAPAWGQQQIHRRQKHKTRFKKAVGHHSAYLNLLVDVLPEYYF